MVRGSTDLLALRPLVVRSQQKMLSRGARCQYANNHSAYSIWTTAGASLFINLG